MFDLPAWSETIIFLTFPTKLGSICSYVFGSLDTADTWRPPLCAKAEGPT